MVPERLQACKYTTKIWKWSGPTLQDVGDQVWRIVKWLQTTHRNLVFCDNIWMSNKKWVSDTWPRMVKGEVKQLIKASRHVHMHTHINKGRLELAAMKKIIWFREIKWSNNTVMEKAETVVEHFQEIPSPNGPWFSWHYD